MPWVKKYVPQALKEIVGQDVAVEQLKEFVLSFQKQKKKALLLYGPSGVGKTSAVHALAKDLSLEIIEVNASDTRNEDQITATIGNALKQRSLFSKGKIILVDEVDGLSGQQDRGGIPTLARIIENPAFPVILTANDPWDSKFNTIRSRANMVQFQPLNYLAIYSVLAKICVAEKIKADEAVLKTIARRASGDLRAAMNDLQSLARKSTELTKEDLEDLSERDRTESMTQALVKIFKSTQPEVAITALDGVDEDTDSALLWIDENLPREYQKSEDLARAYEALSAADVFRGRIRRWQHWRFLVYVNAMMTAGVAVAKDEKYHVSVNYTPTRRILKIWQANQKYQKRKAIAGKIASHTHASTKQVMKSMSYIRLMAKSSRSMAESIAKDIDLSKEELEWLKA